MNAIFKFFISTLIILTAASIGYAYDNKPYECNGSAVQFYGGSVTEEQCMQACNNYSWRNCIGYNMLYDINFHRNNGRTSCELIYVSSSTPASALTVDRSKTIQRCNDSGGDSFYCNLCHLKSGYCGDNSDCSYGQICGIGKKCMIKPDCDGHRHENTTYRCAYSSKPMCKDKNNPSIAKCVECLSNGDCTSSLEPKCNLSTNICEPEPSACDGDYNEGTPNRCPTAVLPACKNKNTPSAVCVECTLDTHCPSSKPKCNTASNLCEEVDCSVTNTCPVTDSLSLNMTLSPNLIGPGEKSTVTITVTNGNTAPAKLSEDFTIELPDKVRKLSTVKNECNSCTLESGQSCEIIIEVTSDTLGDYIITTSNLTTDSGTVQGKSDTLYVRCKKDQDCPSDKPVCENPGTMAAQCVASECNGNYNTSVSNPCKSANEPICLRPGKADAECVPNCDGDYGDNTSYPCVSADYPVCKDKGSANAACVECIKDADCPSSKPVCNTSTNRCEIQDCTVTNSCGSSECVICVEDRTDNFKGDIKDPIPPTDIVFVLDSTTSVSDVNWNQFIAAVNGIANEFDVGPGADQTRMSVVEFGNSLSYADYKAAASSTKYNFIHGDVNSLATTKSGLSSLNASTSRVNREPSYDGIGPALIYTKEYLEAVGRPNAIKIVFAIHDMSCCGFPGTGKTGTQIDDAKVLKDSGIFIVGIRTLGSAASGDQMASPGLAYNMGTDLSTIVQKVKDDVIGEVLYQAFAKDKFNLIHQVDLKAVNDTKVFVSGQEVFKPKWSYASSSNDITFVQPYIPRDGVSIKVEYCSLCGECIVDPDCKNPSKPLCGTNYICGVCNGNYNGSETHICRTSVLPYCKDAGQSDATCVECLLDSHCSSTEICDNNKCIPAASVTVQVTLNPSTITTNDKGKLIITITNPNTVPIVLDENFDTTVPSDVNISNISGSCGAVIVGNIIRLNKGANINANGSCTITADLGSDSLGRYDVVTGNITTNIGNVVNPADKVLIVQCFTNNDCPSSEPICGTDNTCDDCNGNMNSGKSHECFENDKKYCKNPGQNNALCVECLVDSNCSGGQICVGNQCVDPVCDSDYGSSKPFACKDPINKICDNPSTVNAKCRPVCDGDYGGTTNYPCKTKDDPICKDIGKATAECVECNVDSDCQENEVCYFNQCVEVGNGSCTSFYRNFPDSRATQITDNCGISGAHANEVNYNFNLLCNDNKKAVCILCRKHMQWTLQEKSKSSYSKDDDSGVCEIVRCIYDKFDPGSNYKCNTRKIVSEPYTIDQVNKFSVCGNNKKEGPEECDGGSNCDDNCQLK